MQISPRTTTMNSLALSSSYPVSHYSGNGDTDMVALSELPSTMHSQQPLGVQLDRFLWPEQHRSSSSMSLSSNTSCRSGKCFSTFPIKLHSMLTDSERLGFDDVVCWLDNQAFRVIDPHRFSIEILPVYFNQTKYKSFQRQ
jgi:HSF-type DNA-binding